MFEVLFFATIFIVFYFNLCDDNLRDCRINLEGGEYMGKLSLSLSGKNCEFWAVAARQNGNNHEDYLFPDGSKGLAKNYCRNPTREPTGPWCYVNMGTLVKEVCAVPYCQLNECRWTGTGEEYRGTVDKSVEGLDCITWAESKYLDNVTLRILCPHIDSDECRYCRNPFGAESGPLCLVWNGYAQIEKLCHVAFCQDGPAALFMGKNGYATTFHKLPSSLDGTLKLKVRLWQPRDWLGGRVTILLSALNIPTNERDIKNWGSGLFITLGNGGSAITGSMIYDRADTPGILSATNWTDINIKWKRSHNNNFIVSLYLNEGGKASLVADLDTSSTLLQEIDFHYFSVMGTLSFWEFFAPREKSCLVTTTSLGNNTMWLELMRDTGEANLMLLCRIYQKATIHFRVSPVSEDVLLIHIYRTGRVVVDELTNSVERRISDVTVSPFNFWTWERIKLSTLGDSFLALRIMASNEEVAVNVTNVALLRQVLWAGVSSYTVTDWIINCDDNDEKFISKPEPPECITSSTGLEYKGIQGLASNGKYCVPWIDERIPAAFQNENIFKLFGSRLNSVNYCRNLGKDASGPFCFVETADKSNVERMLCNIRSCMMGECKNAGTGSDYFGKLAITRSQRICQPKNQNESEALCRNPTNNLGGPWCQTDDPLVPMDFCYIDDCARPIASTILTSTIQNNSNFFILPGWRKDGVRFWVKNWNPENDSTLYITMATLSASSFYKLLIGGGSNEKVQLFFVNGNKELPLFEETASHMVRSGTWNGLWLRCELGSVELGHEGMHLPFFQWEADPSEENFQLLPEFLSFGTTSKKWLGISFLQTECLVERVWGTTNNHFWPIGIWKKAGAPVKEDTLELFVQGAGTIIINLIHSPENIRYFSIVIEEGTKIYWTETIFDDVKVLNFTQFPESVINESFWTKLTISTPYGPVLPSMANFDPWYVAREKPMESSLLVDSPFFSRYNESFISLETGNEIFSAYSSENKVLLFYWFRVEAKSGLFSWASNCQPLELGGKPVDGGWGLWSGWKCSTLCGGGEGRRERICDNPKPNLLGKECVGPAVFQGVCNDFPCGDAPPNLLKKIRKRLSSSSVALSVLNGEAVELDCNQDLASELESNIPNIRFWWTLNGLQYNSSRASNGKFNFDLINADISHCGVWICTASWSLEEEEKSVVVAVTTLIVKSDSPTALVRYTLTFNLYCNAVALSYIFADLSQRWELNGSIWRDYGTTLLPSVAVQNVSNVTWSDTGVWTCIITQKDLGLEWVTAWTRLEVIQAPSIWSNLVEDEVTAPIFRKTKEGTAKFVTILVIFLIIAVPVIGVIVYSVL